MNSTARKLVASSSAPSVLVFLAVGAGRVRHLGQPSWWPRQRRRRRRAGVRPRPARHRLRLRPGVRRPRQPRCDARHAHGSSHAHQRGRRATRIASVRWARILGGAVLKLFVSAFGVTDYTEGLGHELLRQRRDQHGRCVRPRGPADGRRSCLDPVWSRSGWRHPDSPRHRDRPGAYRSSTWSASRLTALRSTPRARSARRCSLAATPWVRSWLFILAPLVGAVVASLVWRATRTEVDITPEDMIAGSERSQLAVDFCRGWSNA